MKPRRLSMRTRIRVSLRPGSPSLALASEPISRTFLGWPGRAGLVAARAARASGVSGAAASRVLSSVM